jgi:hypothetical protein
MKMTGKAQSTPPCSLAQDQMDALAKRLRAARVSMPTAHAVRLPRALSWLKCASLQLEYPDLRFVSLWVAFNACYANGEDADKDLGEREAFRSFVSCPSNQRVRPI